MLLFLHDIICFSDVLILEMKQLESHPMFNPAIRVVDAPQKEKKVLPVSEDKEDLGFKLFEHAEKAPPPEKGYYQGKPHLHSRPSALFYRM